MAEFNPFGPAAAPQAAPMPQAPPQSAPASPEELEARKSKWRMMFDKIDQDPAVRNALIGFGAQMLQPIQENDSFGASLGRAVNNSIGYLQATRQAGVQQAADAEKQAADIGLTKAQTAETQAQADTTRPKAESAIELNQAQAGNLRQATNESVLKTPAELEVLRSQAFGNIASGQAAIQNAGTNAQNAATNASDSAWRQDVANQGLDIERLKLAFDDKKLAADVKLAQEQMAKDPGYTPSADIQMLQHYIALEGGDVEAGTQRFRQEELAPRLAANPALFDGDLSSTVIQNLMSIAGYPEQKETAEAIDFAVRQNGFKGDYVTRPRVGGGFDIYVDGKKVLELAPQTEE